MDSKNSSVYSCLKNIDLVCTDSVLFWWLVEGGRAGSLSVFPLWPRRVLHYARLLEGVARLGGVTCDAFDVWKLLRCRANGLLATASRARACQGKRTAKELVLLKDLKVTLHPLL